MALKIAFHGGKCCGIRHIHGFNYYPSQNHLEPALKNDQKNILSLDRAGVDVSSSLNVFYKEAPEESLYERLDRYIKFLKEFRPGGVIEVCLARQPNNFDQIKLHEEELFKHGFSVATELLTNSNTGNTIRIYHLITKG
jgi:hypothetical protein